MNKSKIKLVEHSEMRRPAGQFAIRPHHTLYRV